MQASQTNEPGTIGRLPDDVYALRGAAYAERVGIASAAQGAVGGDFKPQGCAEQRCGDGSHTRRAGWVRRALCEHSIGRADGGFAGQLQFPAYRIDAMLAILVGAGQGFDSDHDLMVSTGLRPSAAKKALHDCKAQGLIEEAACGAGVIGWVPSLAGVMALQTAQDARA